MNKLHLELKCFRVKNTKKRATHPTYQPTHNNQTNQYAEKRNKLFGSVLLWPFVSESEFWFFFRGNGLFDTNKLSPLFDFCTISCSVLTCSHYFFFVVVVSKETLQGYSLSHYSVSLPFSNFLVLSVCQTNESQIAEQCQDEHINWMNGISTVFFSQFCDFLLLSSVQNLLMMSFMQMEMLENSISYRNACIC